ncbi:site-specific integrase [Vibrio vulnificus]|uniref:site-specific integrase n=1 Tax=Vibrio vulnificus TaxID=672 RepID=UPI0028BFB944|nr:site-specific integrase [Vibrio vulnificus]HDY7951870.1 site-specific integrase [Vibrio vulnificus]
MGKFASPAKQAASVMKSVQGKALASVGTVRNYEQALTRVAEYTKEQRIDGGLRGLTPEQAILYLEQRGEQVGQKALDMERQAIQCMMQHVTGHLTISTTLPVIKSEQTQALSSRAYTAQQAHLVSQHQTEKHSLATQLAHACGLRAHELLTLRPREERLPDDRLPDDRPSLESKWSGREGKLYTVEGKGGLVRDVLVPHSLSQKLETLRHEAPKHILDRGVHYTNHYAIGGGQPWSNSFSAAANRCLGWSEGAHGLRHSYAQERMHELQSSGLSRELALETVSQEMGHFRPEITEVYLR